jgi:hypothetical protein
MVLMWIVLIAVVLVAVGVLAAGLFRRPSGDDLHSVRSYHSALGTLEHLSDRVGPSTVRPRGRTDGPGEGPVASTQVGDGRAERDGTIAGAAEPGATRSVPPVPVRGRDDFPDPGAPLIFDDARPIDRYRSDPAAEGVPAFRSSRAQKMALDSMNHRPRRTTAVMLVAVVLVFFGALAYIGSRRSNPSVHPTASSTTRATNPASTSTTAGSANQGAGGGHANKGKTKVTPTTVPSQIVASSSTGSSAAYPVGSNSFTITVTATGPCWVQATTVASRSTLWAGSLQAGTVHVIQATGPTAVQFGTPTVSFTIGTVPVVLPTPLHTPFVATFQPTTAASTSTSTTGSQATGGATGAATSTAAGPAATAVG